MNKPNPPHVPMTPAAMKATATAKPETPPVAPAEHAHKPTVESKPDAVPVIAREHAHKETAPVPPAPPVKPFPVLEAMREALKAFEVKEGNSQFWEWRALMGNSGDPSHNVECQGTLEEKEEALKALLATGEIVSTPHPETLPLGLRRFQIKIR